MSTALLVHLHDVYFQPTTVHPVSSPPPWPPHLSYRSHGTLASDPLLVEFAYRASSAQGLISPSNSRMSGMGPHVLVKLVLVEKTSGETGQYRELMVATVGRGRNFQDSYIYPYHV